MIDAAHFARKTFFALGRSLNAKALAPRSFAGIGAILMLHRVTEKPVSRLGLNAGLAVKPAFLERLMTALKEDGYDFLALDELPARIANPEGKRPFLAITFDDGYKDNAENAFPLLRRMGIPWTVYIAPGLVNAETHLWWELAEKVVAARERITLPSGSGRFVLECRTRAEKAAAFEALKSLVMTGMQEESVAMFTRDLAALAGIDAAAHNRSELMGWDLIRQWAAEPLCTIGTHTRHHYHLARLADAALKREFVDAQAAIELEAGIRPGHVAYPYGYKLGVGWRETEMAASLGYNTGVTTRHGMIFPDHVNAMTALPRISLNGRHQQVGDVRIMLSGLTSFIAHRHGGPVTL